MAMRRERTGATGTTRRNATAMAAARKAVAEVSRRLASSGMVPATAGNVSVRVGELVAITPTSASLAELTPAQVSVVDLDGRLVHGGLEPSSELGLHLGIYREHGAGAVVHTHAPACTAVASVRDELPCIHYAMLGFGGAVPVAPYATFGSAELAANVVGALIGRSATLMASHGAITYGPTLAKAYEAMELLEWACDLYLRTLALGEPRALTDEQAQAVVTASRERQYGTMRKVGKKKPRRRS
ncbi:MAG: class II aldolase/adducin family protein [Candidatus Binatia bacterium]